jgi:hypothetical protein
MRAAFDLTVVSPTAARPAQHTLRHACGRTYLVSSNAKPVAPLAPGTSASTALMCGRTYSSWAFRDLLLGHFSPISPSFFPVGRTPLHSPFSIPPPKSLPKHPNHRRPSPPNHSPSHRRPLSDQPTHRQLSISRFFIFSHFSTRKPIFFKFFIFFFSFSCGLWVLCCLWLVLCCLYRGLGCFERGFQTLWILGAHQVFEEVPQPTFIMPRGQGSSARSTGTQGIVARQPIESRRLILENTFAIKEEFSNNEATS